MIYLESVKDRITDEDKGKSLLEVNSFSDVFTYIIQAADGMPKVLVNLYELTRITNPVLHHLHREGWIHRGFTPGYISVVGKTVKISDFEFAKRRVVD